MRFNWSELNSQQKGTYGEYFAKMEFTMYGFEVYTAEVDDRGIDFIARKGEDFYEVQVKTITNFNYQFVKESKFKPSSKFVVVLIRLVQGKEPEIYVFTGDQWTDENELLTYRAYEGKKSLPEYGINVSKGHLDLLRKFKIEQFIEKLDLHI
jgi:hypothetical protein